VTVIAALLAWLVASSLLLALLYRRALSAAWREPVLRAPVLIFESDDWGYGPPLQAERLERLADVLCAFRDCTGRHPVATLGVVLAGPDCDRMREDGCRVYHRLRLDDPRLAPVREAMLRGKSRGVFVLQLHGMEHFWPASVLRAAPRDARVRQWLTESPLPATEDLPAPLQSRWIDASALPSVPLPEQEAIAAASDETSAFAAVFAMPAEVVVPSTFVWNDAVERAWTRAGMRVIVTPGLRNESRDADGRVVAGNVRYCNGDTNAAGATLVVRDAYFEPALGHTHEHALAALRSKTTAARPALLEMHRFNYLGDAQSSRNALEELRKVLQGALAAFPNVRFMSTAELAQQYRERSSLVDDRPGTRLHFLIRRLATESRLRKLAWMTGAALPAWLAYVLTRPAEPMLPPSPA
jgi:hypothetical protein